MLKFYTYLYALAYLRSERQWGEWADHRWMALVGTSFLLLLNVSTVLIALDGMSLLTVLPSKPFFVGLLVAAALFVWFTIQQSGRGERLIDSIHKSSEQVKKRGDRFLVGYVFTSVASMVVLVIALIFFTKHGWTHPA